MNDSDSLELRIAFHNAVWRFQDWTADVAEPKVRLCGRFWPISKVCQEIADLSDPLPKAILSVLHKERAFAGNQQRLHGGVYHLVPRGHDQVGLALLIRAAEPASVKKPLTPLPVTNAVWLAYLHRYAAAWAGVTVAGNYNWLLSSSSLHSRPQTPSVASWATDCWSH